MSGSLFRYRRKRLKRAALSRSSATRTRVWGSLTTILVIIFAALAASGGVAFFVYQSYANDLVPPEQVISSYPLLPAQIYDRNGELLYENFDPLQGLRDPLPLNEVSPYLIAATVATEDASFYDNPGVNFRGIGRALMENFTPFGPGFFKGSGGSSITQQLVKNIYISEEDRFDRQIDRKIKEAVFALELKDQYSDDQIMEWYLNQIFYGNFSYGIQAASQRYFGKSAKDLTLAEAAMLAGIPSSPANYSPVIPGNEQLAIERQHQVLDLMLKHHDSIKKLVDITPAMVAAAKDEQLSYATQAFSIKAPHFVFYVQDQLTKMCKKGEFKAPNGQGCDKIVEAAGLRVTTTLDLGLEHAAEDDLEAILEANENIYGGHNGAVVAIDPRTGEILTMVGSRDYFRQDINGEVNVAASPRSHGSTMKMFTYLTAFEHGWAPSSVVKDAPLTIGGHTINNWNSSFLGDITVRKAMSESVNTTAVRTAMELGEDAIAKTAHKMGITSPLDNDCGPTITLGSCEVKLVDMAFAYSVLANNGNMIGVPTVEDLPSGYRSLDPVSVLKIQDAQGKVLYEAKPQTKQVVRPAFAYMVTDILSKDAISWSRLSIDRPAATKTGTSEQFRDNVVMGYTPELSIGVWVGNSDGTPMAE
ncbi:MAG TPA: transglycosylase domain-containing protein, partial [Dehalococcoidia bacterium]|nr:transglycosylase domain-containing protein [Dehalococcoidia bacterium]